MATPAIIEARELSRSFDGGRIVALRGVSLTVRPGEAVAVLGQSGSGKSTLLNLLSGIDVPTSGVVYFAGDVVDRPRDWTRLRSARIGLVFQHFHLLPTLTAIENVELPMLGRVTGAVRRRQRARALMDEVGILDRANARIFELSGGERQRVAIARAIANEPDFVLADEPTGSLDRASGRMIIGLLSELRRQHGTTLVLVTHDPGVAEFCSRRIELADGSVISE
jgi:putative ABC transport system ATP-binding protein